MWCHGGCLAACARAVSSFFTEYFDKIRFFFQKSTHFEFRLRQSTGFAHGIFAIVVDLMENDEEVSVHHETQTTVEKK